MIKIIKEGHKQYRNTCFKCGCEYSYELEDVHKDGTQCPQCGTKNCHSHKINGVPTRPTPYVGQITIPTDNMQFNNPCANCNYTKKLATGQVYIGDSPCTWCEHNPFRVTCTSIYTNTTGGAN